MKRLERLRTTVLGPYLVLKDPAFDAEVGRKRRRCGIDRRSVSLSNSTGGSSAEPGGSVSTAHQNSI